MAKKRRRHREYGEEDNMGYNNPFGISQNQLMQLISELNCANNGGNIANLVNTVKQNGVDFSNSYNTLPLQDDINLESNKNLGNAERNISRIEKNKLKAEKIMNKTYEEKDDIKDIEWLFAMRKIVSIDKVKYIDRILELFKEGVFDDLK